MSNFDIVNLQNIVANDQKGLGCNQVLYNFAQHEVEWAVAAWCRKYCVLVMAYSPLDQGSSLLQSGAITDVAARYSATVPQIALAWLLHQPDTVVIPNPSNQSASQKTMPRWIFD